MSLPDRCRLYVVVGVLALSAVGSAVCLEQASVPSDGPPIYSLDGRWVTFTKGPLGGER